MTHGARAAAAIWLAVGTTILPACQAHRGIDALVPGPSPTGQPLAGEAPARDTALAGDLDAIFADPILSHALLAVQITSLGDGRLLYGRNAGTRVIPASNMKIVTVATAAERLGWDFRFETRLDRTGDVADGVLRGDLVVTGSGDPSIAAQDLVTAPLFAEWADALQVAGIRRVEGRLIGDDDAFDDEALGAGWAWDYLAAGYAAPSGALSYNENVAVVRVGPGAAVGAPAVVDIGPPGHGLMLHNQIVTGEGGSTSSIAFARLPGSADLAARGSVPIGGGTQVRTTTVDNPTRYFVEGFRLALAGRGIPITGGAWDIDDASAAPAARRTTIATHRSLPLSSLAGYAMKVSQNFYGDMLLKALGHASGAAGSAESGRLAASRTLERWGLSVDTLAMYDGSGLSRYNYASADLLVGVLAHVWHDETLRGPFAASLPVGGHDGTLEARMRGTSLDRRVQAKTGTISNVRALSGYAETAAGDRFAFAMIANNFTAPSGQVDAVMERALERLVEGR